MFAVKSDVKTVFYGTPTIYILESTARFMKKLVDKVAMEVGWLMVCQQTDDGDFILSDCIVPAQECHSATTELTPEGLDAVAVEVMNEDAANGITDPDDDRFRVNHLNAWFHSHASMGVSPSGQDDQQMVDFCQKYGDDYDVWIRGIVNKSGDIHVTVYYKLGKSWKVIVGCPVQIMWESTDDIDSKVEELVSERVKKLVSSTTSYRGKYAGTRSKVHTHRTYYSRSKNKGRNGQQTQIIPPRRSGK